MRAAAPLPLPALPGTRRAPDRALRSAEQSAVCARAVSRRAPGLCAGKVRGRKSVYCRFGWLAWATPRETGAEQGDADGSGTHVNALAAAVAASRLHSPNILRTSDSRPNDKDFSASEDKISRELAKVKREIGRLRSEFREFSAAAAGATGEERLLLLRLQVQARDKEADLRKTEAELQAKLERSRAGMRPALRVPSNVSPSQMGLFWQRYQFEPTLPVAYACFRPPVGPPRALPAALVHPTFGRFLDAVATPLCSLNDAYALESNAAWALLDQMPRTFSQEVQRQDALLPILSLLLGTAVAPFCPSPETSKSRTDGGVLWPVSGFEALLMLLEMKNEVGSGGGDPWFQAARGAELFWSAPEREALRACSVCPTLILEVVGPILRVSALAMLPEGGVLLEPLTPFLSCLPVVGQTRSLDALIVALRALRLAVDELRVAYTALQPGVSVVAAGTLMPYPLADVAAFTDVRHWCADKLLYAAMHAVSGRAVCIKFIPRSYGADVHAAWAAAGLAPALLEHRVLPGGVHMVVMELLRPEDGWLMLAERTVQQRRLVQAAVLSALRAAHAVPLPGGGFAAHGDCRAANVLVRESATPEGGVTFDVRFVDFDWAGRVGAGGAAYPPLMSPSVNWPDGAVSGAPLQQAHDEELLTLDLF